MSVVQVRVELRSNPYANFDEREAAFKRMLTAFKKQCDRAGVQHSIKEHAEFESRSRKRRRKSREQEAARAKQLKQRLKDNFTQRQDY